MSETEQLAAALAEVERLRAKLEMPCGSCHPCENYADETWRKAGRKPPHVVTWEDKVAAVVNLHKCLDDALQLIDDMANGLRQDHALNIAVETRRAAIVKGADRA
jgi:hypothetical protein